MERQVGEKAKESSMTKIPLMSNYSLSLSLIVVTFFLHQKLEATSGAIMC